MDLTQHLKDLCLSNAEIAKAGITVGRREGAAARDALRAVVAAYDKALAETPDLPLTTPLMCAIEGARRVL